jgi:hypothetical protein
MVLLSVLGENPARPEQNHVRLGDVWSTLLAATGQSYADFGQPRNGIPHKPIESLLS